jgi:AcrR family transcriptional regulator
MARRTKEEAEETRKKLLRAGRTLFARRGFDGVSLEDIAGAAGVTRGALYHHFEGKLGVFREVTRSLLEEVGERILARAGRTLDAWEGLEEGCRAFLDEARRPAYRRIVLLEAPSVLGIREWQELDESYTTRSLHEALSELAEEGSLQTADPGALAEALSGAMNQLSLWASSDAAAGDQENRSEAARTAMKEILRRLRQHSP